MARIRSVKPELCESETMAALPAEVERTFVRLWTHCDDEGRCKDNPKLIKAAIFPLHDDVTPADVDAHLSVLAAAGCVVRYEVDGVRCLAVPSWKTHQHPQKPRKSVLPEPPDNPPTPPVPDGSRTAPVDVADESGPVVEGSVGGGVGVNGGDYQDHQVSGLLTTPVPDDQTIREAAKYAGRAEASVKADSNPVAYAASVTDSILLDGRRSLDLERIRRMLGEGMTPEQVGAAWMPDPLAKVLPPDRAHPTGPAIPPWDPDRHQAEADRQREQLEELERAAS